MRTRKYILAAALIAATCLSAQQVNTLYFLESAPMRHIINPAFQPVSRVYFGITPLSYTGINITNNVAMSDLIFKNNEGKTVTAFYPGEADRLKKTLGDAAYMKIDAQFDLLNIGVRYKDFGYFYFNISERLNGTEAVSTGIQDIFTGGGTSAGQVFDLATTRVSLTSHLELMAGYSHKINEQWTVGGKLKFIYASAHVAIKPEKFTVETSMDKLKAQVDGNMYLSAGFMPEVTPGQTLRDVFNKISDNINNGDWTNFIKAGGYGGAIDLGATYKPIKQLQISLAVTDLGFIHWMGTKSHIGGENEYKGATMKFEDVKNFNGQQIVDSISGFFNNLYENVIRTSGESSKGYNTMLNCKLNAGVDANFWDNRVGVGVYSRTSFYEGRVFEEVTLGAAFRPVNWFNIAASYSFIGSNWNCIGFGLNLMPYDGLSLTLTTDYIPFTYASTKKLGFDNIKQDVPVPYKVKSVNFAFGLNIVIGSNNNKKKDSDKDGVPDYLDMCPLTPKDVNVDKLGCPLDTDGDGVPDYDDRCPTTPDEAYGMIDEKGCPTDEDKDGVPDYKDECPNTPAEAAGYVDEKGCALDSDGDGVPDYKDHCPATPAEARGKVDENGCPLDTDQDGVPDYLDECPDTPRAAYGLVDEKGCPLDSDGDGVPDYLDECPDTPAEAKGYVDAKGCLLDTDQDGVPDYMDECPTVPGVKYNKGCPEVQKEVKTLLQKAMSGIEFETGKAVIKKQSFAILNQIAVTFIANPSYKVEVQGHTDNVGKPEMNKELSEKRAQAVRKYLVDAGVPATQLTAHGYGDEKPIADNKTKAGRAKNRRVEFNISFEEISYETVLDHVDSTLLQQHLDSIQPKQLPADAETQPADSVLNQQTQEVRL